MGARNLAQSICDHVGALPSPADYSLYYKLVKSFPLQSITSQAQYKKSLKVLEFLLDWKRSSKGQAVYTKTLVQLIEAYESSHFTKPQVSSCDMLDYLMKLKNVKQADLAPILGGQSVVSSVLNKKRQLNVRQIKALALFFKVSPHVFL